MRFGWRGVLGIALSALLLWFTLRGEDLGEIWRIIASSKVGYWALCVVTATAIFPLRARRWQALLAPLGPRLPLGTLWRATAIGMMVSNVFPARAGEFMRAFALSRSRRDVPFPAAFGSIVLDRVFDGVCVLALLLLATLDARFPSDAVVAGQTAGRIALTASLFLGAVLAGVIGLVVAPAWIANLARRIVGLVWKRGGDRLAAALESFAHGLRVLHSPRLVAEVAAWTLLHWLTNTLAFWFGFQALGIDAGFTAALFVQGLIAIGVALPSAPGFFGPFELAAKAGLALFGVPTALAVSWAIGFHILSFIPITVLGAWYFTRMHLHVSDLAGAAHPGSAPR